MRTLRAIPFTGYGITVGRFAVGDEFLYTKCGNGSPYTRFDGEPER